VRHLLTDKARLLQIVLRLSILWAWAGIWAFGATAPHSQSRANVSWQRVSSPMSCPRKDHRHTTRGLKREEPRTYETGRLSVQRIR
jgi:hypothetical protein